MRFVRWFTGAFLIGMIFILPAVALAQEEDPADTTTPEKIRGPFTQHVATRIGEFLDTKQMLWGNATLVVPERVLSIEFSANYKRANSRFDSNGKSGPIIEPISLSDPFAGAGDFFTITPNTKGHGFEYEINLSYGVTTPVDVYFTSVFQTEETWLDIDFDPGSSSALGIRTRSDLFDFFETLGRPAPSSHYKSKTWEAGDFHFGVLWNYFRNDYYSGRIRARGVLPTGRLADPNNALIYLLGSEIDAGKGSFGPGISHSFDLRGPKPVAFMSIGQNVDYTYYVKGKRRSPKFLTPDAQTKIALEGFGLDMTYFPDLSAMDDYYFVTPGHTIETRTTLMFNFPIVGFGGGYEFNYGSRPIVDIDSPEFEQLLELTDAYTQYESQVAVALLSVDFYLVKVPIILNFETKFPIAGRNQVRYQDDYKGDIQIFLPF